MLLRGGDGVESAQGAPRRGDAGIALAFRDVAAERGLTFRHGAFRFGASADPAAMVGGGLCWLDADGDGWLDLFVVNSFAAQDRGEWKRRGGLPTSRLFHNERGRFTDVTRTSGAGLAGRGQGCVAADLDRDGDTDLFVTTTERNALLWNDGDGTFSEDAEGAGVDTFGWFTGAAAGDVDGDGWPDLAVTGYVDPNSPVESSTLGFPNTYRGRRDLLYVSNGREEGRVTFREVGAEAGLEVAAFEYGLGVVFSDLDRDGDLDVYVANDTNPNRLYENVPWPGGADADPAGLGFRFEERAASAGVADPNSGMGIAVGDYDGDGRGDLFVTNARRQAHAVYRSLPPDPAQPSFADVRDELGPSFAGSTGWGVSWGDFDLDADLDLFVANGAVPVTDLEAGAEHAQLFENTGSTFRDATSASGLLRVGPVVGRGSAAADYDNDGDLDVALASIGGPLRLLENAGTRGNWLEVELKGFHPGAEVTVVLPNGRKLRRELRAGGSYLSSEDPRLHFGLGTAQRLRALVVRWPAGGETRLTDVVVDRLVVLEAP
jgi:hypothetical protein